VCDENDNVIGILGTAFALRDDEAYLSATYLEYFSGLRSEQIESVVWAVRASDLNVGGKAGFVIGNVGEILIASADRNHKIRIVYEPSADNMAHSAVRRWPTDDAELLEILAAETWAELVLNSAVKEGQAAAPDSAANE